MIFYKNRTYIKIIIIGYIFSFICLVGIFILAFIDGNFSELTEILVYFAISILVSIIGFVLARKFLLTKIIINDSGVKIMYHESLVQEVKWDEIKQIRAWYNAWARYISLENQDRQIEIVFTLNPGLFNNIVNKCKNPNARKLFNQIECTKFKHRNK